MGASQAGMASPVRPDQASQSPDEKSSQQSAAGIGFSLGRLRNGAGAMKKAAGNAASVLGNWIKRKQTGPTPPPPTPPPTRLPPLGMF